MKHLIIISVYNKPILTRRCIESVIQNTDLKQNLLFIVDDHSNEKTKKILDHFSIKYPQIVFHQNTKNMGKPKSINVGLQRYPKMDYYTIIDNDVTILSKNWVKVMMNAHKDWNDQAILGAYTYMNGYAFTRNGRHYLDPWPYWNLAGCFFSFSKKVFKKLGYFSEVSRRSEDADYCRRAFLAGFRWFYIADIKARISGYKDLKERNRLAGFQRTEQKKRLAYSNYVMLTHDVYYPPRGQVKKGR